MLIYQDFIHFYPIFSVRVFFLWLKKINWALFFDVTEKGSGTLWKTFEQSFFNWRERSDEMIKIKYLLEHFSCKIEKNMTISSEVLCFLQNVCAPAEPRGGKGGMWQVIICCVCFSLSNILLSTTNSNEAFASELYVFICAAFIRSLLIGSSSIWIFLLIFCAISFDFVSPPLLLAYLQDASESIESGLFFPFYKNCKQRFDIFKRWSF